MKTHKQSLHKKNMIQSQKSCIRLCSFLQNIYKCNDLFSSLNAFLKKVDINSIHNRERERESLFFPGVTLSLRCDVQSLLINTL